MGLTDTAIERIKAMIVDGRLKPGDRLPREADLAEQLGISRGSLREAVRALSLMRVLDVRQGDGTYVTSLTSALLLESMAFVIDLHQDNNVLDLFEVRRALEPLAAEKAALRMTAEQGAALMAHVEAISTTSDIDAVVENDLVFHRTIAEAAGNPVLSSLIEGVAHRTFRARLWRGLDQEDALEQTIREHRAIARAIVDGNPVLARTFSIAHIAGIENWIRHARDEGRLVPGGVSGT